MKRNISVIFMLVLCTLLLSMLFSCQGQDENIVNSDGFIKRWVEVTNIEELESMFIFSRLISMVGFADNADYRIDELKLLYDISPRDVSGISFSNLAEFYNFFVPTIQFDGFELMEIDAGMSTIVYWYMPIGANDKFLGHSDVIQIRFENLRPRGAEIADLVTPLIEQRENLNRDFYLSENKLLFEVKSGYNEIVTQIPGTNIRMRMTVPSHIPLSTYEAMRAIALSEFVPANIQCVEEMIAQRLREREVIVTFPGMSGVTVSHFTDLEWVELPGTFEDYASFIVPNGTSHVRATSGEIEHTFILPRAGDFATVLSAPVSDIGMVGVSVYGDNVHVVENDSLMNVPVPASIIFPTLGRDGEYWAILISQAGGNYPIVVTVTDTNADFSGYFYTVRVPAGVTNLRIWSNETYIVDIDDGITGGGSVTLMKTEQPAGMSFTLGGTARNVNFTLDGSDPFADFR